MYFTIRGLARFLDTSETALRYHISAGHLRTVKSGWRRMIPKDAVDEFRAKYTLSRVL